jgi:hypothetical protein
MMPCHFYRWFPLIAIAFSDAAAYAFADDISPSARRCLFATPLAAIRLMPLLLPADAAASAISRRHLLLPMLVYCFRGCYAFAPLFSITPRLRYAVDFRLLITLLIFAIHLPLLPQKILLLHDFAMPPLFTPALSFAA